MSGPADAALQPPGDETPSQEGAHDDGWKRHDKQPKRRPVEKQSDGEQRIEHHSQECIGNAEERRSRRPEKYGASAVFELTDFGAG